MSPLELYLIEREEFYLSEGLDIEESRYEALGDYYKNYASLQVIKEALV